MRAPSSLFWKFFLAIWAGYVLLIGVSAMYIEQEYRARYSKIEVSERYSVLADYIISRYEQGVDISRNEFRQNRPELEGQNLRNDVLAIQDLRKERLIFGDRSALDRNNRVSWLIMRPDGGAFMANVAIPPPRNPLPAVTTPTAIGAAFITSLLYSWLFTFVLTRPITRLKTHVQLLGRGDLDQKLEANLMHRRDEIGDLASSIDEMSEYIQELLNSKQRLLFDVSHELRAPLARMQVAAAIVRSDVEGTGANLGMLDRVEKEIDTLSSLISELLLLAKTENDGTDKERVSLQEELHAMIENIEFASDRRKITPHFLPGVAEIQISVRLLDRVIKNLIENAVKYSEGEVGVYLEEDDKNWIIRVEDSGEGIPEDQIEVMKQPFTRMQSESVEGFGLGLSIAFRAAKAIGGSLSLNNRPEGGLNAILVLPKTAVA